MTTTATRGKQSRSTMTVPSECTSTWRKRARLDSSSVGVNDNTTPLDLASLPRPEDFNPHSQTPSDLIPPPGPRVPPSSLSKLACARRSPLVCVNQALLNELAVIIKWKEVGEDDKGAWGGDKHSLSYKRACSVSLKQAPSREANQDDLIATLRSTIGHQGCASFCHLSGNHPHRLISLLCVLSIPYQAHEWS